MNIHKVIFAGLLTSFSLAQANPVSLKSAEPTPMESVASIVEPIGKELVTLTSLPARPAMIKPANEMMAAGSDSAARKPVVTSAGMARNVQIEVDAPVATNSVAAPSKPMQENDINMFLLAGLMIGAIMLRRRAE